MALSCGSISQCCHVGYAHRHCEHCNEVVRLEPYAPLRQWPYWTEPAPYVPWRMPIPVMCEAGSTTNLQTAFKALTGTVK